MRSFKWSHDTLSLSWCTTVLLFQDLHSGIIKLKILDKLKQPAPSGLSLIWDLTNKSGKGRYIWESSPNKQHKLCILMTSKYGLWSFQGIYNVKIVYIIMAWCSLLGLLQW
jgi:hypothetical protein